MRAIGFVLICTLLLAAFAGCGNALPPQASDPSLREEATVFASAESTAPANSCTEAPGVAPTEAPTAEVTAPATTADPDGFPNVPDDGHSKLY